MAVSTFREVDDLPVYIRVQDVANIAGISLSTAYNLTREPGFPASRLRRRIIVDRDKFLNYISERNGNLLKYDTT